MAVNHSTARRSVKMPLNDNFARERRALTTNLSEAIEPRFAAFAGQTSSREMELHRAIDRHIVASNAFVAEFGTLADEFSTL